MLRITKKTFIDTLCNTESVFAGSVFKWNDDKIIAAIGELDPQAMKQSDRRTVRAKHSNHVVFSNGSYLYFNQNGEKTYLEHECNGIKYIMQKTHRYDDFDKKWYDDYVVYALCA